jgi:hypothetical protein
MKVRRRQRGFGEAFASQNDMQDERCTVREGTGKPNPPTLQKEHSHCVVALAKHSRATSDLMALDPRWMQRCKPPGGDAVG